MSKDSLLEIKKRRERREIKNWHKARGGKKHILRVKKTNLHLYLLVREYFSGKMLFSASSLQLGLKRGGDENLMKIIESLIEKLRENKINSLSLDRGYHSYRGTLAKVRERLLEAGFSI